MMITEYKGFGEFEDRIAKIFLDPQGYRVVCSSVNANKEILLYDKSLRYAEDIADNWVLGILND